MLKVEKVLIPLFHGNSKQGFLHIVVCDEKGYEEMVDLVDKHDTVASTLDSYPPFKSFAGLAYERVHVKGHRDWWVIFPKIKKTNTSGKVKTSNKATIKGSKSVDAYQKITIDSIAHEATHIARMILDSRGVLFDPNNDEPYAYMIGWLSGTIYNKLPKTMLEKR